MEKLRGKLTYPHVVSTLALFVALGGGAYAVGELGKNDVRSKHIKNGQVKTKDLGKNAVKSSKVADGSLLSQDFAAGQLPQGEPGAPGEDATNLFAYVRDPGLAEAAVIEYGEGVTGVTDPAGDNDIPNAYKVTFDRDLTNCVVQVTSGVGKPNTPGSTSGPAESWAANSGTGHTVGVALSILGTPRDTSFFITAFC